MFEKCCGKISSDSSFQKLLYVVIFVIVFELLGDYGTNSASVNNRAVPPPAPSSFVRPTTPNNNNNSESKRTSAGLRRQLFHRSSIKQKRKQSLPVQRPISPLLPLLSPTQTAVPRLSPLLHTSVSDTGLQSDYITDYHVDNSLALLDIYRSKVSDIHKSTKRDSSNLISNSLALVNRNNNNINSDLLLSLHHHNHQQDTLATRHILSSPSNSVFSTAAVDRPYFSAPEESAFPSTPSTSTTVLQFEDKQGTGKDRRYFAGLEDTNSQYPEGNKLFLFECREGSDGFEEDESLLPLLPPTPVITPIGSPLHSSPATPTRVTASFAAQHLLGNPSGGTSEVPDPLILEPSEYYGDEEIPHHHLSTPLIDDVLQQAEAAATAKEQLSSSTPELQSRGPMRHSAGSALSSSSYHAGASTTRDNIYSPSSFSTS